MPYLMSIWPRFFCKEIKQLIIKSPPTSLIKTPSKLIDSFFLTKSLKMKEKNLALKKKIPVVVLVLVLLII